jgi:hypothetical protein
MLIKKSRINSIDKYFANIEEDQEIYVCVPADENNLDLLMINESLDRICVVPQPIGPITRFNLYGKYLIHKEMEKEPREIEIDYHIVDWHGTDHYGTCFQHRICYPKEYILPPVARIILDNEKLRSDLMTKVDSELLKHTINMFLELFGYCEIIDKNENPIGQKTIIKEVSWRILPPGKYPWERAERVLDDYFEKAPIKNKEVLRNNHKTFAEYEPDFLAIGENSFNGYVVYGYTNRNLYVFESNQPGNDTYVFKGEWENASQLTKRDVIQGNLCHKRIIHAKTWKESVKQLFE